jgi:predicted nucleotidyltransferase component of viral defense system
VFQGGTALRLCYGGDRYSEDLDFVCPEKFQSTDWQLFEEILKRTVARNFGCEISLQPPKEGGGEHVVVERWQARVYLPREVAGQARTERINIEVAHLPAWDAEFRFIRNNHPLLAVKAGYSEILLQAESEREILADKVVALAGRPYLKGRDVWDVNWLLQRGVTADPVMVAEKAQRYGLESLDAALDTAIARLRDPSAPERFRQEMSRFLLSSSARHLADERFAKQFFDAAVGLVEQVRDTSTRRPAK